MIMDARVQQEDGYRFIYRLPFSETDLMIEDTHYSSSPQLDRETLRKGLDRLAGPEPEVVSEEEGILPVLISGELNSLWPARGEPIARLGVAGGFFHPTTGYSLPDAAANALLLCELRDFSAASVHKLLRSRATKLWRERRFFQILNRMLFRAAKPGERYRVLEHFYRLPEPVIGRFYAARLTTPDKVRILSGRPPVPVFRALAAMRSVA
jgi:lycopene beta-cyclase